MTAKLSSVFRNLVRSLRLDIAKRIIQTLATRIWVMLLMFVASALVARVLGVEGRGLYALATTVGVLGVQFCNIGLHASNNYFVAREPKKLPILLGNTVFGGTFIGVCAAFIVYVLLKTFPTLAPLPSSLLWLVLASIPLGLIYLLEQNLLIGLNQISEYNLLEIVNNAVIVTVLLILAFFPAPSPTLMYGATIIALIIVAAVASFKLWHLAAPKPIIPSLQIFKDTASYGIKAYLAALFSFMVLKSDFFLVQHYLGSKSVGLYSIAVNLTDILYIIPVVVGTILFPELVRIANARVRLKTVIKAQGGLIAILLPVFVLALLLVRPFIETVYGASFIGAAPAFYALIPGILFLSVNTLFMHYFASLGMPWFTVYTTALATALNIALNTRFIPHFGIAGASYSSDIAYGAMLLLSFVYISNLSRKGLYDRV